ncbi:MAG: Gfo/Idh/MocA family oxidoreductase [Kiritimatiellae bacterium]|nr:Gfo/Idh/MocA family oxidoreductase [Kiritimatiellia bacterium]
MTEKNKKIRLALIGCGSHSRGNHAQPMARYAADHPDELELAAACDLDLAKATRFCGQFGFKKAYDNVDAMLEAEQPDACVAIMPVSHIVAMGIKLLERGMPCVIEKPPGATLEEARRLADVARRTGTPHVVSVNRRFSPYIRRAVDWARQQGPLRFVRGAIIRVRRAEPSFVWSTAIHSVDAMRFIAGDVERYDAHICRGDGMLTTWYAIGFTYAGGCLGHLDILPSAGWHEETYELIGEGFRAAVSTQHAKKPTTLRCWLGEELVVDDASPEDEPEDVTIGPYAEVAELVAGLRNGSALRPTMDDVLPSAEICFEIAAQAGVLED